MIKKIISFIPVIIQKILFKNNLVDVKIKSYIKNGRIPWSEGYEEYKINEINKVLHSDIYSNHIFNKSLPEGFGYRLDERIVEYLWIFSKLSKSNTLFLDAGSTFNFDFILQNKIIKNKKISIYTYHPEHNCYHYKRVDYLYGDLRELCFKNDFFDEIVSQSTIEHIDMDNSIYGYEQDNSQFRSYEYLTAIKEMIRVLKPGGKLLLTFPFGKYEHHGFFQQFDEIMLNKIYEIFLFSGDFETDFFKYDKLGWRYSFKEELYDTISFNPHSGKGDIGDGAAHCRSIACIQFIKKVI